MPVSRLARRSAALTMALSFGGSLASAGDNPWAGTPWQPPPDSVSQGPTGAIPYWEPGSGEPPFGEFGSGDKGYGTSGWDWVSPSPPGASSPDYRGSSWYQGFPSGSGRPGSPDGGHLDPATSGWVSDGVSWDQRPAPAGVYRSPARERPAWGAPPSREASGYGVEPWGNAYRPEGGDPRADQLRVPPGTRYGLGPQQAIPGYRFRGDAPLGAGEWSSPPDAWGYRFRPLTDQERGRLGQMPEHGPNYAPGAGAPPFRGEPLLGPESAYGFEPNPWRTR